VKTPLKHSISPQKPLLILMRDPGPDYENEAKKLVRLYDELDDVIRPSVAVQVEGTLGSDWISPETSLKLAEEAGIPIVLQIQGDNGDRHDTMPLERMRTFLDMYECIVGLQMVECSQRTFVDYTSGPEYSMGRNARYARDVIRLAGEYGAFVSWQLMRENYAAIGCSGDNEALYDTIVEYSDYVVPQHEMNCEFAKIIDHMGAMGLWLAGATAQWGVEAQSWYWHDAGYNQPGTYFPGTLDMPGGLYAIMFLLGASAGASAYSIEPPQDIWVGEKSANFHEWLAPTFKRLIVERLIPTRDEVLDTMPLAYRLPLCRRPGDFAKILDDLDYDHSDGRLIRAMDGVYEPSRDSEMIPNNPRYGWIPALPTKTPQSILDRFERVIVPGDITSIDDARRLVDAHFPPVDAGEAWGTSAGSLTFACNSHENTFIPESVKLAVPMRPTNVRIEADGGSPALAWDASSDTGETYRVWQACGETETCLTPEPISETRFALPDSDASFAVSAITSATEAVEGTLQLHQYLMVSNRESRRSAWFTAGGEVVERPRLGEAIPEPDDATLRNNARTAELTPVEDLDSPVIADGDPNATVKREVLAAMAEWKCAIESEDIERILARYSDDYREPDGRTTESVDTVFRSMLWRYLKDQHQELADEWSCVPAWSNPVVRVLVREWLTVGTDSVTVETMGQMWAGAGPELEPSDMFKHPFGRPCNMTMTWKRTRDGWKLAATDPAFLRVEDTLTFRFVYQGW